MAARHKLLFFLAIMFSIGAAAGIYAIAVPALPQARAATETSPAPAAALAVATVQVRPSAGFTRRQSFSGRVQARRASALGFDTTGRLARVHVTEGTVVAAGDLLAELDTDRLVARRAERVAAVAEAEARLALADATLARLRGVVDAGGVSRQGLDEAREGRRAAVAALDLARQRVASLDVEMAKQRLLAPYAGTVIARQVDEGQVLASGAPVVTLQENRLPEIRVGVAGPAVEALREGEHYELQSGSSAFTARLRSVLPVRSAATRTVDALFDPVEDRAALRPGDVVTLHLGREVAEPGTWLPLAALTEGERGLWSVYLLEAADDPPPGLMASHRLVRRTVDLIHQEADRAYVRGALAEEARIVAAGLQRVVPGQWVRTTGPLRANAAPLAALATEG